MNSEEDKDNKNEAAEKSSKKKDYRPHQRNLISVNSILHSVIKDKKLVDGFARYQFVLRWKEIVGEEIAKRTAPECLRGSTLVIRVCNSVWAQELSFQKSEILKQISRFNDYGKEIDDIKFIVGDIKK